MRLPEFYQGDDIPVTRGPFTDDEGNIYDLSTLSQVLFKTGTDPRYVAEFSIDPTGTQRAIAFDDYVLDGTTYPNALAIFTIESDQTRLMKIGTGIIEDFVGQDDTSLLDDIRNGSGEAYAYVIKQHKL